MLRGVAITSRTHGMGEQVGIQPRVRSQNNSRVLENAFRNVLQEELWENFPYPNSVARLLPH